MTRENRWRDIGVLAAIGLVTGFVTYLLEPKSGPLIESLMEGAPEWRPVWRILSLYMPGFIFGAALGAWLCRMMKLPLWRALGAGVFGAVSWYTAVQVAVEILTQWSEIDPLSGPVAGLVGGVILVSGIVLFYPAARDKAVVATVSGAGFVFGTFLYVEQDPMILFLVWQTGVAGLLGDALYTSHGL